MRRASSLLSAVLCAAAACALGSCQVVYGPRVCDEIQRGACNPVEITTPVTTLRPYRDRMATSRPTVGAPVDVRNVTVSAIDNYSEGTSGAIGDLWVQERVLDPTFTGCAPHPQGGRVCGVQLFAPNVSPAGEQLRFGDLVNITGGTYDEFNCGTCSSQFAGGRTLPELSRAAVTRVGSTGAPEPIPATLDEVVNGGDNYVGVLVRLTDTITLGAYNARFSQYPLVVNGVSSRNLNIAEQIAPLRDAAGQPYATNTRLRNVVVVVSFFFNPLLLLRSASDYEVVP